jgi:hypothetical protein
MSRWAEAFAALSRAVDTSDTSRHIPSPTPDVSRSVHSVTPQPEAVEQTGVARDWSDTEEERASIVEYDGGIPRAWAEGFARLHPDRSPGDVPATRWVQFINDVGGFLDGPFCVGATALGWGPLDLFGSDRARPFAHVDKAGLLWMINGGRLIALTAQTATIERRAGIRHTYRRKPGQLGQVLAWELEDDEKG